MTTSGLVRLLVVAALIGIPAKGIAADTVRIAFIDPL